MGISIKAFFLDDENNLERVPTTQYHKLYEGTAKPMLKYAGKTVRGIEVLITNINGQPQSIDRIIYALYEFDDVGKFDQGHLEEWKNFGLSVMLDDFRNNEFAEIEYQRVHNWQPEPHEEIKLKKEIREIIFGRF